MAPHFKRNTAGSKYTSDGLFFHLNPNYKPSTRPPAQNHRKRIHKSLSLMSLVDAPQSPEPEIAYRAPAARMHAGLTTQLPSNIVQDASRANRTAVAPQDIFKMSYTTPITATDEDIFMMTELVSTEDDDIVEVDIEIARSSSKAERRDVSPDPRPPKKAKSRPSTPDDDCPIPKPTPDDVYGISEEPGNRAPDRKLRDRTKKVPDKSYKRESPKIPIQGYSLKKLDNYKYPVKVWQLETIKTQSVVETKEELRDEILYFLRACRICEFELERPIVHCENENCAVRVHSTCAGFREELDEMELENENPWYCSDDCKPDTTSSPSLSTNTTSTKPQKRRTRAKAPPVPDTIEESIDDTSTAPKFQRDESSPVPQQRRARTKASYVPKTMEDSIDETTKVTLPHRAKLSTTPQHSANVPHVTTIMEDFIKEAGEEFRSHGRKLHYAKTNIETKRGAPLTLDELEFIHGARKSWAKKFEEGRKEFVAKMKEKGYLE